ncbi:MAG: hypothetical protein Q9200_000431 [Gallowayella weberi]
MSFSTLVAFGLGAVLTGYIFYSAIWRLNLSPIAHIPGSRFAALTFWNEFYYDVWLGGKYTWKLLDYHERYGPVIRINPYEVHINDPEFYEELYVGGSKGKTNKWHWSMRMFGQQDLSAFDTLDHDKHRQRREPWNPYFSKQSVTRIQPLLIQAVVDKLCTRLAEHQRAGKPVVMTHAFSCVTSDIISEYSFPEGYNLLDRPEFDSAHYEAWMSLSKMSHVLKQFGWLYPLLDSMPMWVTRITSPEMYLILKSQNLLLEQATKLSSKRGTSDYKEMTSRPSMMQAFMDSPTLPESDKTPSRIKAEAQIAIGAGTLTTTHALKAATYHILANPDIHDKLMTELEAQIPDPAKPPSLRVLEQMPYLSAIMHETLRIFYGNSHRLQRIFPSRVVTYKDIIIPPGTPISMSAVHVHDNPTYFPDPYKFDPGRWQGPNPPYKYIVPFGKGSRMCVGMELAKAEILTTLANMFRRFGKEIELYETSASHGVKNSINRYGLTEVFTPAHNSEIDIVFVHGLNGHPYDTWASDQERKFWPSELLPPSFEDTRARVLTYGYPAGIGPEGSEVSGDRIHNHAEQLVQTLCANRKRSAAKHPIIFIAHSLGGILVKRALIFSSGKRGEKTERLRSIFVSTYGIVFLGTPHLGAKHLVGDRATWISWSDRICRAALLSTSGDAQSQLFDALKPNSEALQNIDRQFVELMREFRIFYFHEMIPTEVDGDLKYIVDEGSAAPVHQDIERAGIHQDHDHMCKFDNNSSPGFMLVSEAVGRYASEAPKSIERRWQVEQDEQRMKKDARILELCDTVTGGISHATFNSPHGGTVDQRTESSRTFQKKSNLPEPPPRRFWVVPRDPIKGFIGREAQLDDISTHFVKSSTLRPQVLILHALGGQGKSQIVLKYCQRWREKYPGVFWVNASSEDLALQSYARIASILNGDLSADVGDKDRVIEIVKSHLEDWDEPWLMVFDNYDQPDVFTGIRRFFPEKQSSHVIVTSRHAGLDRLGTTIELPAMSPDEGVHLLLRSYSDDEINDNLETAKEIVHRLGRLPLAIDQAAAYIKYKRIPSRRLGEFLHTYEVQREKILKYTPSRFWEYNSMQIHGEEDQSKAINAFMTWEMSLEQLITASQTEKDELTHFLTLSAFFNPTRIEEPLFSNYWNNTYYQDTSGWLHIVSTTHHSADTSLNTQNPRGPWDTDKFWEMLVKMHELSLLQNIENNAEAAAFSLHPLVRDWLQVREKSSYQQYVAESFLVVESSALICTRKYDSGSKDQRTQLLPHVDACLSNDEQNPENHQFGRERASHIVAYWIASLYCNCGRYESAEKLMRRVTNRGDVDMEYYNFLGGILFRLTRYHEVVQLCRESLQLREEDLVNPDPRTWRCMSTLATALSALGKHDEAEKMLRELLQLNEEILGKTDKETLGSMVDLAHSLHNQGKYADSEKLARETLALCQTALEPNLVFKLDTMSLLALALHGQKLLDEGRNLQLEVVQASHEVFGKDHPQTMVHMHNLAMILEDCDSEESEKLYRQLIQSRERVLRRGHPDTLISIGRLAALLRETGAQDEAVKLQRQVV